MQSSRNKGLIINRSEPIVSLLSDRWPLNLNRRQAAHHFPPVFCVPVKSLIGSWHSLSEGQRWTKVTVHQKIHDLFINYVRLISMERTKILRPYNLITPIGTIGSHLSPLPGISFGSNLPALAEDKGMPYSPL